MFKAYLHALEEADVFFLTLSSFVHFGLVDLAFLDDRHCSLALLNLILIEVFSPHHELCSFLFAPGLKNKNN